VWCLPAPSLSKGKKWNPLGKRRMMIHQTRLLMLPKTRSLDTRKREMRNKLNEYLLGNVPHTTVILSCVCIVYSVYLNCPVL
jgi:hypothetical protein